MNDLAEQFIKELNEKFNENLSKIKFQFENEYVWPDFNPLRDEIAKCLICDLCQAAITLTNHLVENFIKTMLSYKDIIENKDFNNNAKYIEKYDGKALGDTLIMAKSKGLITKEQWKVLDGFRDEYRNAYSHAEKKKIFKNNFATKHTLKVENGLVQEETEQVPIINLIIGQGIAQFKISKGKAFNYFISIDEIIRDVIKRIIYNNQIIPPLE